MTMKAIIKTKNSVALRDVSIPRPKLREILIKVALTGLCRTDTYAANGSIKVKEGTVLGHEFSGTIERLGSKIRGFKIGDRVVESSVAFAALCRLLPDRESFERLRGMDLFQATRIRFDTKNTDAALRGTGMVIPPPDVSLLERYLSQILKNSTLPMVPPR